MSGSITRRDVLSGAAAIAGVTALPPLLNCSAACAAAIGPTAGRAIIGHVVLDERLEHSAAFAAGFDGARVHPVNALDDLCNRWYTQLRAAVRADTAQIAGLTTWMDYIVMRDCAAEIGYGRAFHAEHSPGTLDLSWARTLGQALASGAHRRSPFNPAPRLSASATTALLADGHLVSWVFSPRN